MNLHGTPKIPAPPKTPATVLLDAAEAQDVEDLRHVRPGVVASRSAVIREAVRVGIAVLKTPRLATAEPAHS